MKLLITGGAGFIGSNFTKYIIGKYPDFQVAVVDALTYAGNLDNLVEEQKKSNFKFKKGDIRVRGDVEKLFADADAVVHFAAETHVDRSILDADSFITTDIYGTYVLLELAKQYKLKKFVHISTDEVYGEAPRKKGSLENDPLMPKSPYAASKTGADRLVFSYFKTYGLPVTISRCSNNYGPYQYPEKLIPLFVSCALQDKSLPVYGTGKNTRDWIHVLDHCRALDLLLHSNDRYNGEVFNIGSAHEYSILNIGEMILEALGKPKTLLKLVKDRPGHVLRHAVDTTKLRKAFNWKAEIDFAVGIKDTTKWYQEHQDWWKKIIEKQKEYQEFSQKWYKERK